MIGNQTGRNMGQRGGILDFFDRLPYRRALIPPLTVEQALELIAKGLGESRFVERCNSQ
ncbi:MAG: hypothetical protein FWD57_13435 [Polyangiaceae bacterium]|nr:hypothetical protein [Polyangiaceae bacterium]